MPLMPKRVKYRKQQKGKSRGIAQSGNVVSFGEYGLQALERHWITNIQIERIIREDTEWTNSMPVEINEAPLEFPETFPSRSTILPIPCLKYREKRVLAKI